jgi:hypothetical protein
MGERVRQRPVRRAWDDERLQSDLPELQGSVLRYGAAIPTPSTFMLHSGKQPSRCGDFERRSADG